MYTHSKLEVMRLLFNTQADLTPSWKPMAGGGAVLSENSEGKLNSSTNIVP